MIALRRRWAVVLSAWVVVSLAGGAVLLQMAETARTASVETHIAVTGPLVEREQYPVDLNTVAAEIAQTTATYLTSDSVLWDVARSVPAIPTAGALKTSLQVGMVPNSSIIRIVAQFSDATVSELVVSKLQQKTFELVETFGVKRFDGESPLSVSVMLDTTRIERTTFDWGTPAVAVLVLAVVAALAAALLWDRLDPRIRDVEVVRETVERKRGTLRVLGGPAASPARLRAELDAAGVRTVAVVGSDEAPSPDDVRSLLDAFDGAGGAARLVSLGTSAEPSATDPDGRVSTLFAVETGAGAVSSHIAALREAGADVVVVDAGAMTDGTGFALVSRIADAVILVVNRSRETRSTLARAADELLEARPDSAHDLVWYVK